MNDPRIINSPDQIPNWDAYDAKVVKIVVGELDEDKRLTLQSLPTDFATRFPNLTHLHLWGLQGLDTMPELPPRLKCLDLRKCEGDLGLPDLPPTLETLDLGGCVNLQSLPPSALPSLSRLYLDECRGLKRSHLEVFLERQGTGSAPLLELDASGTVLTSLDEVPRASLRKLCLRSCPQLELVRGLERFPMLEHLDLSGCEKLGELPELPPQLRYLVLHGAHNLTLFKGQDIGPYDRGTENENVASAFLSRRKFGGDLAVMPHAKLLLMGDGRVGKTTLAKRLQWEELGESERLGRPDLRPRKDEDPTHRIWFWQWHTGLSLPAGETDTLDRRAAGAGAKLPKTAAGDLAGAVRLWDFGGQEIYHSTHRIFAGEGSIFLVVWREDPPAIGNPPDDETSPQEWKEWNRTRPLVYWLDYIYSMRPDARVALVCTNCDDPDQRTTRPAWQSQAPSHRHRDLELFCVDSLDERCGTHADFQRLVAWIRRECGAEARRIGILQPRLYRQVSDMLAGWLSENARARNDDRAEEYLVCAWQDWHASMRDLHAAGVSAGGPQLDEQDVSAITDYLHQAGHLFQIRDESNKAVVVDQAWAADLIYRLLLAGSVLRRTTKRNGGWFYRSDLESDASWTGLKNDVQRARLLAYMEQCRVVTRIADASDHRFGEDVFLASDKWLLPPLNTVRDRIEREMGLVREQPGSLSRERFEFESLTLTEFDFRALQAQLARSFGTKAVYFRSGLQAMDDGGAPEWCFRMRWIPAGPDALDGTVDGVLVSHRDRLENLAEAITDLFFADGSPLANCRQPVERARLQRVPAEERDLGEAYFGGVRPKDYDVAVSSSGADRTEAEAVVGALKAAGLKVDWYRLPECRVDDGVGVLDFMNRLRRRPCIVLLLSDGYLREDPEGNWYCAWEMADAIRQLGSGSRAAERTLVVYKESGKLTSSNLDELVISLFTAMGDHFARKYAKLPFRDRENFTHYDRFSRDFAVALDGGFCGKFFQLRTTLGSYQQLPNPLDSPGGFDPLIAAVTSGLRSGGKR